MLLGFHQEAKGLPEKEAFFCGKTPDVFGVEVYRRSGSRKVLGERTGNVRDRIGIDN